jgi:hypothetical protein
MADTASDKFYVKILTKLDGFESWEITYGEPSPNAERVEGPAPSNKESTAIVPLDDFSSILRDFRNVIDMYLKFIPMILTAGPAIVSSVAKEKLSRMASLHGSIRHDISTQDCVIYELSTNHLTKLRDYVDELKAMTRGTQHIPEMMIVGLISSYDYLISRLLTVVFTTRPEIVMTNDKQISLDDLDLYKSIDELRRAIIEKEVESIIRESHHTQFDKMEKKLGLKLRSGLSIWPRFIELCERRNLFTHTGGIVSQQYLNVCKTAKFDTKSTSIGQKLEVDPDYFRSSVRIILEIGAKLCYVLWRKFGKDVIACDSTFGRLGYELLIDRHYPLAESLLSFGVQVIQERKGEDRIRRMMVINLANSIRLQGQKERAVAVLGKDDWSATDDSFKICVSSINENAQEVARYIRKLGKDGGISAEEYRNWPVFRGMRGNKDVADAFSEVFGEDLD